MAGLKNRLEKLEAHAPAGMHNVCVVEHLRHGDCAEAEAKAVAEYEQQYGRRPEHVMHVKFISATDKQAICGCDRE
jgi:hypothetical protein